MDETKRSLVKKLAEVMAAVSHVPKTGHNNFHHYDYATEADITASVRQELAKRSVMLIPSVESCEFLEVLTNANKKERLCTMKMTFTAHDGESGETIPFNAVGQGQDASDKAAYKAATGATKYALLKLFLIPTGDDPEADGKPQQRAPQKSASQPAARQAAPSPSKPVAAAPAVDAAQIKALVDAFAGYGITKKDLETRLGWPLETMSVNDLAGLRAYFAKKRELASGSADELAAKLEAERAEKGIADEAAKAAFLKAQNANPVLESQRAAIVAANPVETAAGEMRKQIDARMEELAAADRITTPVQSKEVARNAAFKATTKRIESAPSEAEATLIASQAASETLFGKGELAALARAVENRVLIIRDKQRESKRRPTEIQDVP